MSVRILHGDCLQVMRGLPEASVDSVVTDPPYHLIQGSRGGSPRVDGAGPFGRHKEGSKGFMGKTWDGGGIAFDPVVWSEMLRVLKPGGHLVAFGGSRTYHRLACAVEDARFEIRDQIMWLYGSGFPKSLDVSKAIDKAAGAEREVVGVKPGHEEFAGRSTRGHIDFKDGTDGFDRPWMHDDDARARYHQLTAPATDAARQWSGWGTALKPAHEPIVLARKPMADVSSDEIQRLTGWEFWCSTTSDGDDKILTARALHPGVRSYRARFDKEGRELARDDLGAYAPFMLSGNAAQVLATGTGALNVDATRVGTSGGSTQPSGMDRFNARNAEQGYRPNGYQKGEPAAPTPAGRWPPNLAHDGSDEILEAFARFGTVGASAPVRGTEGSQPATNVYGTYRRVPGAFHGDTGSAARFFPALGFSEDELRFCYTAKASRRERGESRHPTIKPLALIRWLARLITPPGGTLLDPFAGSGTTGEAALLENFNAILIEREAEYLPDIEARIKRAETTSRPSDPAQPELFA